jgi:hypothetical protein
MNLSINTTAIKSSLPNTKKMLARMFGIRPIGCVMLHAIIQSGLLSE